MSTATAERRKEELLEEMNAEIAAGQLRLDAEDLAASKSWDELQREYLAAETDRDYEQVRLLKAAIAIQRKRGISAPAELERQAAKDLRQAVKRLAALDPLEYEQVRKSEAKQLKIDRIGELDRAVKAERQRGTDEECNLFPLDETWSYPVDGRQLVKELSITFRRFSVLPKGSAITAALWAILTYCFDSWTTLPLLAVLSPEKRCGKTTFLTTLRGLCYRALPVSNISPAAVYRAIEAFRPTLLIDEGDTFLRDNEELRGVINSGHTKATAFVIRCDGEDNKPTRFSTWCPKSLAMIGTPPDTIQDRSIILNLRRKLAGEETERHGDEVEEDFRRLRSMIRRWVDDNEAALRLAKPQRLTTSNDRQADNWRPLLAIAHVAGCEKEAIEAGFLAVESQQEELPAKTQLLQDIKAIFEDSGMDRIASAALVKALVEIEDRPWGEWKHGKPLTQATLARMLKPFSVHSKHIRLNSYDTAKGYLLTDFEETFTRYTPGQSETTKQVNDIDKLQDFKSETFRFQSETETGNETDNKLKSNNNSENVSCFAFTGGVEADIFEDIDAEVIGCS